MSLEFFSQARAILRVRLTEECALSPIQRMMVHSSLLREFAKPFLPEGWSPTSFKTSGEVDVQRRALQTLCNRLTVVSIWQFRVQDFLSGVVFLGSRSHCRLAATSNGPIPCYNSNCTGTAQRHHADSDCLSWLAVTLSPRCNFKRAYSLQQF